MSTSTDDGSGRIVVSGLSKHYGSLKAVDDLSFTVQPGSVTGFLGPNGAGKSTTLRTLLGLAEPTSGSATINGTTYERLSNPALVVGSVMDPAFHPARTGIDHLRVCCAASKIEPARAMAVLETVGLQSAAKRKVGGYSLGMRQRLGLAAALLGDPQILVLDEPANGLDPEGIQWLRRFMRHLAGEGKTVLVSSHLLQEVEQSVDRVVILARGQLVREGTIEELSGDLERTTLIRGPSLQALANAIENELPGSIITEGERLRVSGLTTARIGELAHATGTVLHELTDDKKDLEYLYFQLTSGRGDYVASEGTNDLAHGDMA